jgi:hypothetical protein
MNATLMDRLRLSIFSVTFVALYDPLGTWREERLKSEGAPLDCQNKREGFDVRMAPCMARVLSRLKPDALHTPMYTPMPRACEVFCAHVA